MGYAFSQRPVVVVKISVLDTHKEHQLQKQPAAYYTSVGVCAFANRLLVGVHGGRQTETKPDATVIVRFPVEEKTSISPHTL